MNEAARLLIIHKLVPIGAAGHVNTAAGFRPWPQGERLLTRFAEASAWLHGRGGSTCGQPAGVPPS